MLRRNVTIDVKHFEDCEQLFLSIGRSFTIEALLNFFNMETMDDCPTRNRPPYHVLDVGDNKRSYYHSVLDKFIDEFLTQALTLMNKVALIMMILSETTQCVS